MNPEQEDAYATYRWWSNIMSIGALMAVLTIIGLGWAWLLNGSWVEGLAFGLFLTGIITTAAINNEAFMTRWETQTKDTFEAQENDLEAAWERERNRPDDEYVGW